MKENHLKIRYFVINSLLFFCFFILFQNISSYLNLNIFANESSNNFQKYSKEFNYLLNHNLNFATSKEKNYFLIINSDGCDACAIKNIENISNLKFTQDVTMIISGNSKIDPNIINKSIKKVIYDKKAYFFDLDISPLNNCLIELNDQQITEIIKFGNIIQNQKIKHIVEWH